MSKVSIIIPAREEKLENLGRTLDSIYSSATGEFEVIIGFDDDRSHISVNEENRIFDLPNLRQITFGKSVGIKTNINTLAAMATGKYLLKLDAHTSVGKGFDEILQQNMEDDWVVTPRFYVLNKDTWKVQDERFYDYFYLCCPFTDPKGFRFKAGGHWPERTKERLDNVYTDHTGVYRNLDETPQIHGSAWFMTKDRFFELGGFPLQDPYGHGQEPLWLGLRNWLMGGKVMVNKKTWYAHLHQNSNERGYPEDKKHTEYTYKLVAEHFVNNKGYYLHDFEWFIKKFMPMPTWPENWEEIYADYLAKQYE